jgi:hypothetical protein
MLEDQVTQQQYVQRMREYKEMKGGGGSMEDECFLVYLILIKVCSLNSRSSNTYFASDSRGRSRSQWPQRHEWY